MLASLSGLKNLHLRNNSISSFGALAGLARLEILYLKGNPDKDHTPVQNLSLREKDF